MQRELLSQLIVQQYAYRHVNLSMQTLLGIALVLKNPLCAALPRAPTPAQDIGSRPEMAKSRNNSLLCRNFDRVIGAWSECMQCCGAINSIGVDMASYHIGENLTEDRVADRGPDPFHNVECFTHICIQAGKLQGTQSSALLQTAR